MGALQQWRAETGIDQPKIVLHELADAARVVLERRPMPPLEGIESRQAFDTAATLFPGGPSQDPDEFLPFLEFARERTPQVVVEIGTEAGATHFTFGHGLPSVQLTIAVDLTIRNRMRLRRFHRPTLEVRQVQGSSREPWVVQRVRDLLSGRPIDLLFIDGDHSYHGASADYRLYRPMVREGGLICFHDIMDDKGGQGGAYAGDVPRLWQEVKQSCEHREFVASPDQLGRGIGVLLV